MITYLWIALGGALGTIARFAVSSALDRMIGETFPWGTVVVNISGCLVIGLLATITGPDGRVVVGPDLRQFMLVGLCGGYTTFSSFSLQTLNLIRNGELMGAAGNAAISFAACMLAVWIGAIVGQVFNQLRTG
jgi:CrcB protein